MCSTRQKCNNSCPRAYFNMISTPFDIQILRNLTSPSAWLENLKDKNNKRVDHVRNISAQLSAVSKRGDSSGFMALNHCVVAVIFFVCGLWLSGCGDVDCTEDPNCTSPDGEGGADCCTCSEFAECFTCKPGLLQGFARPPARPSVRPSARPIFNFSKLQNQVLML